ncbi:hypothetical protein GCM10008957_39870 [Deinococcus ruber]|uniref:Uncharacterized protein n=1 Tax=Deinococcus ruber TaxID=1848197 RepID=A0A918FA95_9DEIO|nr:hypothetical protein GCM10008957_39870 [Deinococcus ruber]
MVDTQSQQVANRLRGLTARRAGLAIGLWGEPGIGKTHLAKALLRATPCPSLSVRATQPLEDVALILPHSKNASAWLGQSLERLARREPFTGEQVVEVLSAQLALAAPLVLHAEDLHECSPDQLRLWSLLAARVIRSRGVGLLFTSRTVPPKGTEAVRVSPLSRAESDVLLNSEVGATLPHEALAWIFERAAGNPLFTLEFFRFLARQGLLWNDARRWRWRMPEQRIIPTSVEALIEQVIASVSEAEGAETVLQARAILGPDAAASRVAQVAGLSAEELQRATTHLTRAGLLLDGEVAHPLYAEVVVRGLSAQQRQRLARRAITAYSGTPQQAAPFVRDAALPPDHALELLKQAAHDAQGGHTRWLVQAAEYASGLEQATLALEAATALRGSDLPTAVRLGELALKLNPHDVQTIDLLAGIYATRREQDALERVLAQLPESEQGERGLWRQVRLKGIAGDDQAVYDLVRQYPGLLQSNPETCYDIAWSLLNLGLIEEAEQLTNEAQQHPELTDRTRALFSYLQGVISSDRAENGAAELYFRQSLAVSRTLKSTHNIISSLHAHASILQNLGQYSEALAELQEAATLSLQRGHIVQFAEANLAVADQLVWHGEYEHAESLYLDSLSILERGKPNGFLIDCLNGLAELYSTLKTAFNVTLARKYASEALRVSKALDHPVGLAYATRTLTTTLLLDGQMVRARNSADEALTLALASQRPRQLRAAYHVRATVARAMGEHELARQSLDEALRLAAEIAEPFPKRLLELEQSALNGDTEQVREHLRWFERQGLGYGVDLAQRLVPELVGAATSEGAASAPVAECQLEVLGPMRLTTRSQTAVVRGRKRQELLALLLEARMAGRASVSRLRLTEALYPDHAEMRAGTLLADLVYQVRETLGAEIVSTTTDGYMLGASVSSDAEAFLTNGDTRLWRGPVFGGLDLAGRSEAVREALSQALRARIGAELTSRPSEAVRAAQLLLDADPYDLKALALALRAWQGMGNTGGLSRAYDLARAQFSAVGENLPERWEDFLLATPDTAPAAT